MPPRHGKSALISHHLPAWYLGTHPEKRVILASYEATFASSWGRKARDTLAEYGHLFGANRRIASAPSAMHEWAIAGFGGGMSTAGVGGPITGKGADLLIIDDPFKSDREAESALIRNRVWNWYTSTAYTRLEPGAAVIVVQTRWHVDDLIGRLINNMETGGEQWRVVSLPAINSAGEALWPERYPLEALQTIRQTLGSYQWSALYQQTPIVAGGSIFKREWLGQFVTAVPQFSEVYRYWDKAGSEPGSDGDWCAGVLLGIHDGITYVIDVVHGQWSPFERNKVIMQTCELDFATYGLRCHPVIEREPGNGGKESGLISVRELARFGARLDPPLDNKVVRSRPFAAQCEAGNVRVKKGPWNRDWIDEHVSFPKGEHDDQVDATSGAYNQAIRSASQGVSRRGPLGRVVAG